MQDNKNHFSKSADNLREIFSRRYIKESDQSEVKQTIMNSYHVLSKFTHSKSFMNWGLWDKSLYREYRALPFTFNKICLYQDIYAQLSMYHLINPLRKMNFMNKSILDIGCGKGVGLKMASEILCSQYALGLDITSSNIKNSHVHFSKKNKLDFIQGDAEYLPLKNKTFDIILNLESSHLYCDLQKFFSEIERVLKPGGFFCYADFDLTTRLQSKVLEDFINKHDNLNIILKKDITAKVQASIYNRFIVNEKSVIKYARKIFEGKCSDIDSEMQSYIRTGGLFFLSRWRLWLKSRLLRNCKKAYASKDSPVKKHYFYYLVQKNNVDV